MLVRRSTTSTFAMKLRSFFSTLATIVLVLLLAGAGGAFWLVSQNPLSLLGGKGNTSPEAAIFVPKQAPMMASLLVNPDRLESFRQVLARPEERRRTRAELAQFKQGLLATTGLSYQQDVKPWLGQEVTWAVTTLDIDRDTSNGKQPGYLLAIATQDPQRSREFLQLFWQKRAIAGTDLVFEQYKGVKLIYGDTSVVAAKAQESPGQGKKGKEQQPISAPIPSLASAVVGDRFVLFANHPKVLRDAITNVQAPDLNLSSASFYEQALQTLTRSRIGLTFVNLPRLATWVSGSAPVTQEASSLGSGSTRPVQMMALALELSQQGLLAETALLTADAPDEPVVPELSNPVAALRYIPASSPLSASGTDLDHLWQQLATQLKSYDTLAQATSQSLANLNDHWGIDLPSDVFSWVKGEYALGLLPTSPNAALLDAKPSSSLKQTPQTQSDWIFVAQRQETDAAQQGLERLDTIAKQQGLSVGSLKLGDQTVSAWTRLTTPALGKQRITQTLEAEVRGVHATVGQFEIFTSSLAAMDAALKAVQGPMTTDERFQQAIAPLPKPNEGYLYLDWATSQPLLEQRFPLLKVIELAGKPVFTHLQSLTITSYGSRAGVQRGGMFVRLT